MNLREIFLRNVAQTSGAPLALEIIKADGALLYDVNGNEYIDLIGGISVANVGHRGRYLHRGRVRRQKSHRGPEPEHKIPQLPE